jgi:hypothetical protein
MSPIKDCYGVKTIDYRCGLDPGDKEKGDPKAAFPRKMSS